MIRPGFRSNNPYRIVCRLLGPLLLATCLIIARHSLQDNSKSKATITPTVIVRGFLNYRTTVDGTVLLFTPDAGESSTLRAPVATITTSTAQHQLVPSQVVLISGESTVIGEGNPDTGSSVEISVSATPVVQAPQATRRDAEPVVGDSLTEHWRPVVAAAPVRPTLRKEQVASSTESGQEDQSRPSVQADDISGDSLAPTSPPKRSSKFKRPNFSSSGTQGSRARSSGAPTNGQLSSSSGLRRPSLVGSPPATEPSVPTAFQARLSQASAKLRNRFKKQPAPSSTDKPSATGSAHEYSTASVNTEKSADDLSASSETPSASSTPTVGSDEILDASHSEKPEPRLGDQSLSSSQQELNSSSSSNVGLQQGQLGVMSAGLSESFFMGDDIPFGTQAAGQSAEPSEQSTTHHTPDAGSASGAGSGRRHSNNDKLNGWLDQHHNRFVQRPPKSQQDSSSSSSPNKQLAATIDTLTPSFSSNIGSSRSHGAQVKSTPVLQHTPNVKSLATTTASTNLTAVEGSSNAPTVADGPSTGNSSTTDSASMRTLTRVFSTIMTSTSTRVVPMQVQSSAVAVTITEQYVITKMLTAYQTVPAQGEFLVAADELSTKGPMAMLADPQQVAPNSQQQEQPISSNAVMPAASGSANDISTQEQPISFEANNKKSANDWLHDFSSPSGFSDLSSQPAQQQLMQQLLSQQALEGNLQSLAGGEPLDQLASSLSPSSLLAAGNIPDLNNPLVLAAAIQNPQLAAIILAAQQIQLKQRAKLAQQHQQHLLQADGAQNQMALQQQQQQQLQAPPSYSTNLVTAIRPSVYTVRDTMYTTRLVSFKDGRIMRTRTVSEPGSVIEQVLTTSVTEVTPVTVTIKPSGVLLGGPVPMTAYGGGFAPAQLNNAQLNNALIATQLAQLLARRQQQVQPSFLSQAQHLLGAGNNSQPPGRQPAAQSFQPQPAKQFQPNIQQLLASIQQQQQQQQQQTDQQQQPQPANQPAQQQPPSAAAHKPAPATHSPTPPLPAGPFVTTITNLQVRTYTVHNAFKVIYRTITSTQLVTSTVLP